MQILLECPVDGGGCYSAGAVGERRDNVGLDGRLSELFRHTTNQGTEQLATVDLELHLHRDLHFLNSDRTQSCLDVTSGKCLASAAQPV